MRPIETHAWSERVRDYFGLKRDVVVLSVAIFILGLGEELWSRYVPKYLEALGAAVLVVGLYGVLKDFLDAIYQYPGGRIFDTLGARKSLVLFSSLALVGYFVYFMSNLVGWFLVFVGTFFVMAWSSFSLPALFGIIGESLPKERRSIAFAVQSILKRLPIILAPPLGGLLIAWFGIVQGVKLALLITMVLAVLTIALQWLSYEQKRAEEKIEFKGAIRLFRSFNPMLKTLLASDILARLCEGVPDVFIVLYVLDVLQIEPFKFGLLISIQMATSILVYIPVAKLSDRIGRKPFVVLTFTFFALYPLTIALSSDFIGLIIAFLIGGLREIGEPPRKALIVDLAPEKETGSAVGLYYLIRGLSVAPASFIGGLLYVVAPHLPFFTAFFIGVSGTLLFALAVKEKYVP